MNTGYMDAREYILTTMYDMVGEFHDAFGMTRDCDMEETDGLLDFRHSLVMEELTETIEAYNKNDQIEIADGLCDILYVCFGATHHYGMYSVSIFDSKRIVNITQGQRNGVTTYHTLRELRQTLTGTQDSVRHFMNVVNQLVDHIYNQHIRDNDPYNVFHNFLRVHESNMSKLCTTQDEVKSTQRKYNSEGIET